MEDQRKQGFPFLDPDWAKIWRDILGIGINNPAVRIGSFLYHSIPVESLPNGTLYRKAPISYPDTSSRSFSGSAQGVYLKPATGRHKNARHSLQGSTRLSCGSVDPFMFRKERLLYVGCATCSETVTANRLFYAIRQDTTSYKTTSSYGAIVEQRNWLPHLLLFVTCLKS